MLGKKSRIFVLVGMVALLVITGALNIYLNKNAQDAQTGADAQFSSSDFFVTYRTDRNETRNQELLNLDAIITGGVASDEAVNDAQQQKLMLTSAMETELTLEGLIKAVGFRRRSNRVQRKRKRNSQNGRAYERASGKSFGNRD